MRRVEELPRVAYYKPAGVPLARLSENILGVEELEAIRLVYLTELNQTQAAQQMNVSQPTLNRVLQSGQKKIADALVNGKAIRIEGGAFEHACRGGHDGRCRHQHRLTK